MHLTGGPARHAVFTTSWTAWGQPDAWVAAAFDAAARFYRCRPWQGVDGDRDLIHAELDGSKRLGVTVMGAAGISYGLTMTTEPEELLADMARMKKPAGRPRGEFVTLSFNKRSEMQDAGLREVNAKSLPVVDEAAYPQLNVVHCRAGGLPRERAEEFLRVLEAICTLFEDPDASEAFLIGMPWQTNDGSVRLTLPRA
ncbi:MAG: hypothetical protein AAFY88_25515, partial [Acidobacteriota bacterium]